MIQSWDQVPVFDGDLKREADFWENQSFAPEFWTANVDHYNHGVVMFNIHTSMEEYHRLKLAAGRDKRSPLSLMVECMELAIDEAEEHYKRLNI